MTNDTYGAQAPHVAAIAKDAIVSTDSPPLAISLDEAARLTGTSRTFIYKLIRDGKLKAKHLGGRHLVVRDSLMELFAKDETEGVEAL